IKAAASGDMVKGAMPIPADTRDTAKLRWVSNQPVTQAIIGAKTAAAPPPTPTPNASWKMPKDGALLAAKRLRASAVAPRATTGRGPQRSESPPQAKLPTAIAIKPMVIAAEIPVRDHPVALAIGRRKTGSENIAPIATQPSRPPAATMTQR